MPFFALPLLPYELWFNRSIFPFIVRVKKPFFHDFSSQFLPRSEIRRNWLTFFFLPLNQTNPDEVKRDKKMLRLRSNREIAFSTLVLSFLLPSCHIWHTFVLLPGNTRRSVLLSFDISLIDGPRVCYEHAQYEQNAGSLFSPTGA